ncbi:hypothetical protein [Solitalea lacus]|uniref:hypothetical protein n=1 Tax=Solitalea lacus TaxID=2911172 RepID=UPI001EDBDAA1|nr:hypothetical protein [Solitalea lacus]UKJ06705.1 hypothetical protein L2B55_14350 [Solitalea lacus]
MAYLIAEYYLNELNEWTETIKNYEADIHAFNLKLYEIIRRDAIPQIAEKLEPGFELLKKQEQNFTSLQESIQLQEEKLLKDEIPVDNSAIVSDIKANQDSIRQLMHSAEKEFIDAKYTCYQLLSSI